MTRVLNIIIAILLLSGTLLASTASFRGANDRTAFPSTALVQRVPPTKLGSNIRYLASVRGTARALPGTRQARVIESMDRRGGAVVTILFDHALTFAELQDLERRNPIKFLLPLGSLTPTRAVHSAVVPWNKLRAVSELAEVRVVGTELWPPRVPALDPIPSAKIDLAWLRRDGQGNFLRGNGISIAVMDTGIDPFHQFS